MDSVRTTLEETNLLFRQQAREVWNKLAAESGVVGYEYDRLEVRRLDAERGKQTVRPEAPEARPVVRVPVRLRGQVIGMVGLESDDPGHIWTEDELAIIEATANQAAISVENARLLADSQRQAAREQITAEVTARLRASLDMQTVLKTAVSEIAEQLGIAEVAVELAGQTIGQADSPAGDGEASQADSPADADETGQAVSPADNGKAGQAVSPSCDGKDTPRPVVRRPRSLGRARHGTT